MSVSGAKGMWELGLHRGRLFSNDGAWMVDPGKPVGDCPECYHTEQEKPEAEESTLCDPLRREMRSRQE